ncbi:hypothetical protein VNO77_02030 [Canavalia gladiata]|uniref:Uncharacterized protein n=1 Tax=Canavalia gladiata TaxID=3824 RepID=A0AAN9MX50_CANGL
MVGKIMLVLAWGIVRVRELILSLHVKEGDTPCSMQVTASSQPFKSCLCQTQSVMIVHCEAEQILAHVGDKRKTIHESWDPSLKTLCMFPFPASSMINEEVSKRAHEPDGIKSPNRYARGLEEGMHTAPQQLLISLRNIEKLVISSKKSGHVKVFSSSRMASYPSGTSLYLYTWSLSTARPGNKAYSGLNSAMASYESELLDEGYNTWEIG